MKFSFLKILSMLVSIFLYTSILFAQENNFFEIRRLIDNKEIAKAKIELQKAILENPEDASLNLYQAEIWIEEANSAYLNGDSKRALSLYENALKYFPSNPLIQARLKELKQSKKINIGLLPNAIIKEGIENAISNTSENKNTNILTIILSMILFMQSIVLFFVYKIYRSRNLQ